MILFSWLKVSMKLIRSLSNLFIKLSIYVYKNYILRVIYILFTDVFLYMIEVHSRNSTNRKKNCGTEKEKQLLRKCFALPKRAFE